MRLPAAFAGTVAAAAALVWAAVLGPARDDPTLAFPVADYINWRSPNTPVVLNGWLEHFSPQALRDNYGVLRAGTPDLRAALRRIDAGGAITHVPSAIRALEAAGFKRVYNTSQASYLVRSPKPR